MTKIDLRGATLCMSDECEGIPGEIWALGDSLEVLDLSGSFSRHVSFEVPSSKLLQKFHRLKRQVRQYDPNIKIVSDLSFQAWV